MADHLAKYGDLDEHSDAMTDRDIMKAWDELSNEQRVAVLERGKYSGMISSEDDLDFANLYLPTSRESMLGALQDELENLRNGYDVEDTNHYVLKFRNKAEIIRSEDLTKPLTAAQIKNLEFISANSGLSNYRYWCANDVAKSTMLEYMGFVEYRDGVIVQSWNGKDLLGEPLHKLSESMDKPLNKLRKRLVRLNLEHMVILNKNGVTLGEYVGGARDVPITDEIKQLMRNNWVSHNHPTGKGETGIKRFGYSLSRDDVFEAIRCNTRGIVAESPTYRYMIVRPTNGWGVDSDVVKERYMELYNEIKREYKTTFDYHPDAFMLLQHKVMKQLSKEFGFVYSYIRKS